MIKDSEIRDRVPCLTLNRKFKIRDFQKIFYFDQNLKKVGIKMDNNSNHVYSRLLNKPKN